MKALLTQQKQTRRSRLPLSQLIPGWAQVALFGWMICWGNHPPSAQCSYDPGVEYVAVNQTPWGWSEIEFANGKARQGEMNGSERIKTARIDYSKSSPEQSDGRAERERASQFLELVTKINGTRNWKVYGPDLDGRYGGLNGAGGLEAVYNQATSTATYVLSDTYGHGEGALNGTTFTWNPSQSDGYGALAGSSAATPINASSVLGNLIGWRGHYIDATGLYYLGARYYAPDSGTFLSPDPLGHSASMDLYSYCDGDPVNQYDADGRCFEGFQSGQSGSITAGSPTSSAFNNAFVAGAYYNAFAQASLQFDKQVVAIPAIGATAVLGGPAAYQGVNAISDWAGFTSTASLSPTQQLQYNTQVATLTGASQDAAFAAYGIQNAPKISAPEPAQVFGIKWPANSGFKYAPDAAVLQPGSLVDRFGDESGFFVAPQGTPFAARGLPADFFAKDLNSYHVVKPINVNVGVVAPAFNYQGEGIQFELPGSVESLINSGHLKRSN